MIDLEKINERKQVIAKDIEAVRARMGEAQKKMAEDQSLLQALMGAFQQLSLIHISEPTRPY